MDNMQILEALELLDQVSELIQSLVTLEEEWKRAQQSRLTQAALALMESADAAMQPTTGAVFERIRRRSLAPGRKIRRGR